MAGYSAERIEPVSWRSEKCASTLGNEDTEYTSIICIKNEISDLKNKILIVCILVSYIGLLTHEYTDSTRERVHFSYTPFPKKHVHSCF